MRAGVTVVDPATTWVDADVTLEPDVTLLPVASTCTARPRVAAGADDRPADDADRHRRSAPRARVERTVARQAPRSAPTSRSARSPTCGRARVLADGVHIGTYVELKNSDVGAGHEGAAPVLRRRRDDRRAHATSARPRCSSTTTASPSTAASIGDHVRTGADNMFVAPVEVGDGAYTAAGSVITEDVPPGAMAVARAQATKRGRLGSAQDEPGRLPPTPPRGRSPRRRRDRRDEPDVDTRRSPAARAWCCCPAGPTRNSPTRSRAHIGVTVTATTRREFANGELFIRPERLGARHRRLRHPVATPRRSTNG